MTLKKMSSRKRSQIEPQAGYPLDFLLRRLPRGIEIERRFGEFVNNGFNDIVYVYDTIRHGRNGVAILKVTQHNEIGLYYSIEIHHGCGFGAYLDHNKTFHGELGFQCRFDLDPNTGNYLFGTSEFTLFRSLVKQILWAFHTSQPQEVEDDTAVLDFARLSLRAREEEAEPERRRTNARSRFEDPAEIMMTHAHDQVAAPALLQRYVRRDALEDMEAMSHRNERRLYEEWKNSNPRLAQCTTYSQWYFFPDNILARQTRNTFRTNRGLPQQ